jgi:hypothetical protein
MQGSNKRKEHSEKKSLQRRTRATQEEYEEKRCMATKMHYTYCCTTCHCQPHEMQLGLHVKCPIFLSNFNQIWISQQIFLKATNTKLHRNPSSGSNADACRQMGITKLTDAPHVYANVPKNQVIARMCL